MSTFIDAFKRGVKNAEDAGNNKAEIDAVLDQLSSDLKAATEGRIERVELQTASKFIQDRTVLFVNPLSPAPGREIDYVRLVAVGTLNNDVAPTVPLCEFREGTAGYPVTLIYSKRDVRCSNKKALENALSDLLEHPDTGEALKEFMTAG